LLESVQKILGQESLDLLIQTKQEKDYSRYENELAGAKTPDEKLERFTNVRMREGYMAEWRKDDNGYLFIENHCPICSAATQCDGFCRAEIENIQKLLGEKLQVERIDHTVGGDRRCAYRISGKEANGQ